MLKDFGEGKKNNNNRYVLIPVCTLPVVPLLRGRLDEQRVGGEGVKVDQRGLLSPAAAVHYGLSRRLHILEQGHSPVGGSRAGAPGPGQQALERRHNQVTARWRRKLSKANT